MNRVTLIGRLVRDPELRSTPSGAKVVSFTVALDNPRGRNATEKSASFIPCVAWNDVAENVARFMKKGSLVGVDGRLDQRTYQSKDGRNVSVIEVICSQVQFLEKKGDTSSNDSGYSADYSSTNENSEPSNGIDTTDDELPF